MFWLVILLIALGLLCIKLGMYSAWFAVIAIAWKATFIVAVPLVIYLAWRAWRPVRR